MNTSAWVFLFSLFVSGVLSQVSTSPTNSFTNSFSPSFSTSYTNSYTNSFSTSYTNTFTTSFSNSYSNSYTNSFTNSYTNTLTTSYTTSFTPTNSFTQSLAVSVSPSTNAYTSPVKFRENIKRPDNFQCGYKNPNLFCKWLPGNLGYKRMRLIVTCTLQSPQILNSTTILSYKVVTNTSTPKYPRGTNPSIQQRNLVSLDLPPQASCSILLTLRMYSSKYRGNGGKLDNSTGVPDAYTISRFSFIPKFGFPSSNFLTGPFIRLA